MAHEIIKNEDGTFTQVSTVECSINLESYKYQIDALKKMIEETENILKQIEKM